MANRTFGWVQNPSSIDTLRNIISLFVPKSTYHTFMVEKRLPLLASADLFADKNMYIEFQKLLRSKKPIAYDKLKGYGAGGGSRKHAKCSGIVQAACMGQQTKVYTVDDKTIKIKKPYCDDWTADGFLRWAISLGFLDYDYSNDTCHITPIGVKFVNAEQKEERNQILGKAFLSYPPICRVLGLLTKHTHMTKFEIGSKLGFTDEAGFTSFPQNIWVQAYQESLGTKIKSDLLANSEGSSDKYARMICGWLMELNWVKRIPKVVEETIGGRVYRCTIAQSYKITESGLENYHNAIGKTGEGRIPKIVYREMLASKAADANYLRMRRALIIEALSNHEAKSIEEIRHFLKLNKVDSSATAIRDDITGLINIGLDVSISDNKYRLNDEVTKLLPYSEYMAKDVTEATEVKDRARLRLKHIDHKYLTLVDYAFSGKDKCLEFEVYTIDLLVNELKFAGTHLGGSSRPDGIFFYNQHGVIIDNKAYAKGFTITRGMADEMTRYVQENNDRNPERNPNKWWLNFDKEVNKFNFVFISSLFKGDTERMLTNIKQSTGVEGCALTAENLLYYADAIKGGFLSKSDFVSFFNQSKELTFDNTMR